MKIWNKRLIYLSVVFFLIAGISGCIDSNLISKSSVSSKMAAPEKSGIFSEKAYPMGYGPCKGMLTNYEAVYNNGDKLTIKWDGKANPPCDNKFFGIEYHVKNPNSNDELRNEMGDTYAYQIVWATQGPTYSGPVVK